MSQEHNSHLQHLPVYVSHKKVRALKIAKIAPTGRVNCSLLTPQNPDFEPIEVETSWVQRTGMMVGWYFVVYEDNYQSASPPTAFEEGYTLLQDQLLIKGLSLPGDQSFMPRQFIDTHARAASASYPAGLETAPSVKACNVAAVLANRLDLVDSQWSLLFSRPQHEIWAAVRDTLGRAVAMVARA